MTAPQKQDGASGGPLKALHTQWMQAWPGALAAWSKYTKLHPPCLCTTAASARAEGLTSSFAMIRLVDQSIIVSLPEAAACHVENFATEILAHEIGHHILAPATLTDHARLIARMRRSLPTVEAHAPMVANLYTDLLINDRLQRSANLRLADVFRALAKRGEAGAVWKLYLRIYERLWSLERGSLGGGAIDDRIDGDAWLGARLLRSYAREWLDGGGRFAALLLPHLLEDQHSSDLISPWLDTRSAATGGDPAGLTQEDDNERTGAIHPSLDPELEDSGTEAADDSPAPAKPSAPSKGNQPTHQQTREPFQYGEILRAAGIVLSDHDVAIRYYREQAKPHLIPFPTRRMPAGSDPLPEGLEPWDVGNSFDTLDGVQTVLQSPLVIPGMTTVQRVWGVTEGHEPKREPLDLDIYVDSSGSMANPQVHISYPALAGAIVCLSALRAGSRVKATLWSGKHQVTQTGGFVRDESTILRVLTGHYGGATAFPIHALRDTYADRPAAARLVHILAISDDGISTLFDKDERNTSGWDIAAMALAKAGGGGTFVLNLADQWETRKSNDYTLIRRARDEQGWNVHRVSTWEDLIAFARKFSRLKFGDKTCRD